MASLSKSYTENRETVKGRLASKENFDVVERTLRIGGLEVSFFFIDGFVKDGEMQRVMQTLLAEKELGSADEVLHKLPYVEVDVTSDIEAALCAVLSGQTLILGQSFEDKALLVDVRTYPARETAEPDSDRVMQGSHDGFVETLVMNTALIRRRIRDERLRMIHFNIGGSSKTDVVVCYVKGIASEKTVRDIEERIKSIKPRSLTLGFQSLAESLIRSGWYNPFPKIRTTERPDTASAHLLEGSVLVICDTSPQVMILPTSIFDYIQQTDDFYFPPLTGSYLRIVRTLILLLSVVITPLWYLYLEYADRLPDFLRFLIPEEPGAIPIILQLFLVELAIDGLKIASMNTPDMLSNSLSIVGGLILGDFAVEVGWLSGDVILYMAFISIATFAQQNHELGYAFKFMRMMILGLVYLFGVYGFMLGIFLFILFVATNKTVSGRRYLYPLIPFNPSAMKKLIIRERKKDFKD
jgi:stage V sporulation protein AF